MSSRRSSHLAPCHSRSAPKDSAVVGSSGPPSISSVDHTCRSPNVISNMLAIKRYPRALGVVGGDLSGRCTSWDFYSAIAMCRALERRSASCQSKLNSPYWPPMKPEPRRRGLVAKVPAVGEHQSVGMRG
jgi:hypothetical protein